MKKTLSLMLALALVFALVLVAAPAAEAATPVDHTDHTGWTAWDGTAMTWTDGSARKGLQAGKYYLETDITVDYVVMIARHEEVTLCLNGHKLTANHATSGAVLDLMGQTDTTKPVTKLNICDCSAGKTGVIERTALPAGGRYGALVFVRTTSELNVYGGTLKVTVENNPETDNGPSGIYSAGETNVVNVFADVKIETVNGPGIHMKTGGTLNVTGNSNPIAVKKAEATKLYIDGVDKSAEPNEITLPLPAPVTPPPSSNPSTGDSANLVVMGLGLVLGVAGMACLLPKKQTV